MGLLGLAFCLTASPDPAIFLTQQTPSLPLHQERFLTSHLGFASFCYSIKKVDETRCFKCLDLHMGYPYVAYGNGGSTGL